MECTGNGLCKRKTRRYDLPAGALSVISQSAHDLSEFLYSLLDCGLIRIFDTVPAARFHGVENFKLELLRFCKNFCDFISEDLTRCF